MGEIMGDDLLDRDELGRERVGERPRRNRPTTEAPRVILGNSSDPRPTACQTRPPVMPPR